jgi:hypothetical protein
VGRGKSKRGTGVQLERFTELDATAEAEVVSLFCRAGLLNFYWGEIRPRLDDPPQLLTAAVRPKRQGWGSGTGLEGLTHAYPTDSRTANLSPFVLTPSRNHDLGLMAALLAETLKGLLEVDLEIVHISVRSPNSPLEMALTEAGFESDRGDGGFTDFECGMNPLRKKLGLEKDKTIDLLAGDLGSGAKRQALLSLVSTLGLAGLRRPPGFAGNPVADEPGTPDPPAPEPPEPAPPSEPGTPPSPPDGGTGFSAPGRPDPLSPAGPGPRPGPRPGGGPGPRPGGPGPRPPG